METTIRHLIAENCHMYLVYLTNSYRGVDLFWKQDLCGWSK